MVERRDSQILSGYLGNLFEHYDTALFGFLSPFLAPLMFPEQDPLTALILTYAMIPLGMLTRPLGSLVFGAMGDRYGRRYVLFLSLVGMALVSGAIALIPPYAQIGIGAPILFCAGRILQNFLAAGEIMGGAIFLLENTEERNHDLISGIYGASTIGGTLLASFGVWILSQNERMEPGWRYLYLAGCLTALFGCLLRRNLGNDCQSPKSKIKVKEVLWNYRREVLAIAFNSGFTYATYSIAFVLMNGFIPLISPYKKSELMQINNYLLVIDFFALPFFGWLASHYQRKNVMLTASVGVVFLSIPLILSLQGASLLGIMGIRVAFVILGIAFCAPFHAWAQNLIPSHCRYIVISFGYALGSQVFGGPTAAISLWLFQKTGMISSVVWYLIFLALMSALTLRAAPALSRSRPIP